MNSIHKIIFFTLIMACSMLNGMQHKPGSIAFILNHDEPSNEPLQFENRGILGVHEHSGSSSQEDAIDQNIAVMLATLGRKSAISPAHNASMQQSSAQEKIWLPYQCPCCLRRYSHKRTMTVHMMQKHHIGHKFSCTQCDKSFPSMFGLNRHMRLKHPEAIVGPKCTYCQTSFVNKHALRTHVKRRHLDSAGQEFIQD